MTNDVTTQDSTAEERDFFVQVRVKNNRIVQRMRKLGIDTFAELARLSMKRPTEVCYLVGFRASPILYGDWSQTALNISSALHCEPEDLWPEHLAKIRAKSGVVEFEATRTELEQIPVQRPGFEAKDLQMLLDYLPPRERKLIEARYLNGDATFKELGKEFNVTGARMGAIEQRALRRMRRPWKAAQGRMEQ